MTALSNIYRRQVLRKSIGVPVDVVMLASVGELNKNKNHEVVLYALSEIKDKNIHYAIAGVGELRDYLLNLAEGLDISSRVHFLGFRKDVADLYKAADVCIFPSIREGLGLAALEGMACGLPLICSRNRGTNDYAVNGENAFVCKPHDIEAYAVAIKELIENAELQNKMGRVNRIKAKIYDVKRVMVIMKRIYETFC